MLDSEGWKLYNKKCRELAKQLRQQADYSQGDVHEKLWLLAKAQGIEEALDQPKDEHGK